MSESKPRIRCLPANHLVFELWVAVVLVSFSLGFASLRRRVRRTLYDLYCPYFSPEAIKGDRTLRDAYLNEHALLDISLISNKRSY